MRRKVLSLVFSSSFSLSLSLSLFLFPAPKRGRERYDSQERDFGRVRSVVGKDESIFPPAFFSRNETLVERVRLLSTGSHNSLFASGFRQTEPVIHANYGVDSDQISADLRKK